MHLPPERTLIMLRIIPGILCMLLLTACATGRAEPAPGTGACLYALELNSDRGRMLKWDSCTSPPPAAVKKL
jgi:hypothetical protein